MPDDPPLRQRLEALGASLEQVDFIPLEDEAGEQALAQALQARAAAGAVPASPRDVVLTGRVCRTRVAGPSAWPDPRIPSH